MKRCETCGADLPGPQQRLCGGDRCARVFMKGPEGLERTPPVGSIGYTGSYQEPGAGIVDISVVSVVEARGPV
jgi:hypothetical protein